MSVPSYNMIASPSHGEYEEKKSRFLSDAFPVSCVDEATEYLNGIKKKHYDARHHCYAYILGEKKDNLKCSDNGEPQGTAGKPILTVLQEADLTNILMVVTRYFGGTLLGTGGLVRAYTKASQAALESADVVRMIYGQTISLRYPYNFVTPIQRFMDNSGLALSDTVYAGDVSSNITVPSDSVSRITKGLIDLTEGAVIITPGEEGYHPG